MLADGIDLVTFSGDKLLGSVQAGIIVGKHELLERIKKNPLKRALRADKITLAVLEATLKLYEDPDTLAEQVPLLRTLTLDEAELRRRGEALLGAAGILPDSWSLALEPSQAQIGSGALPDKTLPSLSVTIRHAELSADEIAARLRSLSTPVIARISDDKVWLDLRGAEPEQLLHHTLRELNQ